MSDTNTIISELFALVEQEKGMVIGLHQFIDKVGEHHDYFKDCDRERRCFRVWLLSLNSYIASLMIAVGDPYSASAVCRCAMEYSTVLILLFQNKELHKEIQKFEDMYFAKNNYENPDVFMDYYNQNNPESKKKVPNGYEAYGWVDSIREKQGSYTFNAITKCVKKPHPEINAIYENYRILCSLVHPTRIYGDFHKEQVLANYLDMINEMLIYYVDTLIESLGLWSPELEKAKIHLQKISEKIDFIKSRVF